MKFSYPKLQLLLRKRTTPVHLMYGLACAFLCYAFGFWLGAAMMIGFGAWEVWNDWELLRRNKIYRELEYTPALDEVNRHHAFYVPEGAMDFWESTIGFTIGLVVLAILQVLGIVSI